MLRILNAQVKECSGVIEDFRTEFQHSLPEADPSGKPNHIQKIPWKAVNVPFNSGLGLTNLVKTSPTLGWSHVETHCTYSTPFKELPHITCTEEPP